MKHKIIAINHRESFLGYEISVKDKTAIIITPNKDAYVFDINFSDEHGAKKVLSLVSNIIAYHNFGLKFDMMCYSTPLNDKESEHLLRGVYIADPLKYAGLFKPLLKLFMMLNKNINKTHPDCEIPQMHYALMKHFGFKPADGEAPNVMYCPTSKSYYPINGYKIPIQTEIKFYAALRKISEDDHITYPAIFGEGFPLYMEKQLFKPY